MKSQVFVLIPYDLPTNEIGDFERLLLERHRSSGRYDYLVGALKKSFGDQVAEGGLPPRLRRSYSGNICLHKNLPADLIPAALVTPDAEWHDLRDFGWNRAALTHWEKRYRELIAAHPDCWVVEVWAHS